MRAAAAGQFTLSRFEVWQSAIAAVTTVAALGLLSWSMQGIKGSSSGAGALILGGLALLGLAAGASAAFVKAVSVRWDGSQWFLLHEASPGHEPWAGDLRVCIDLGGWMLLRFQRRVAGHPSTVFWLPAQRSGLEAQWHAFRCALYSPRLERDPHAVDNC